jgi:hypothetical protein
MDLGLPNARRAMRLFAVMFTIAVPATGIVACGDEDDPADPNGSGAQVESESTETQDGTTGQSAPTGRAPTGNAEQAREGRAAVEDVYSNLAAAVDASIVTADAPSRATVDAAEDDEALVGLCDLMSEKAKRQTVVYARRSSGQTEVDWTCESATGLLLRRAGNAGSLKRTLRAKVVGVDVQGDRATASVRVGRESSRVSLIKEDGVWKLDASPGS